MSNKIVINDFTGGIAETPESQIANQFGMGMGLDINTPHILTPNQKLSAVGTTELLRAMTVGQRSYGIGTSSAVYTGFNSSNGLYELNETTSSWGLKHTYTGNSALFNAYSIGEYLISAGEKYVQRAYLPLTGTETYNSTVGTFSGTTTPQNHPMYTDKSILYIGNGNKLDKYDFNLSTYSNDILPLGDNLCVTDVISDGVYIALLCKSIHGGEPDWVIWWDGNTDNYNYKLALPFSAEAFGKIENNLVVFGEQNGTIYQVTTSGWSLVANKTLLREGNTPSQYTPVKATVYTYASLAEGSTAYFHPTDDKAVDGETGWTDGPYAKATDGNCATAVQTSTRKFHCFYHFDISTIPADAIITGIEVKLLAKTSTATGVSRYINFYLTKNKNDDTGTAATNTGKVLTTTLATYTWGSKTDLWGTTWSPTDFGDNFGITWVTGNTLLGDTFSIDDIQIKVYYNYVPSVDIPLGVRSINAFSAVSNFKNKLLFAPQYGSILYGGVWSIGKNNGSLAVNYEWKVGGGSSAVYSINNRHLLPNEPPNLYVCVADDYVYEIDYANKVTDAYYESLILDGGAPTISKRFDYITIETKPLPASTSFTVYKKVNGETAWVLVGTYSTTGRTKQTFPIPNSNVGENIQIQFNFTVSGNTAPSIKSYSIDYVPIRK